MRIKYLLILFLLVTAWSSLKAQEMQKLSIEKAVEIALNNSDEAKLADTKFEQQKINFNLLKTFNTQI